MMVMQVKYWRCNMENSFDKTLIYRSLRWLVNAVIPEYQTGTLPSTLHEKVTKFYETLDGTIDWETLTKEECISLGFLTFGSEDHEKYEIWFIPSWLYPIIPEGLMVSDIDFHEFPFKRSTCPFTYSFGALEIGIKLKNPDYRGTLYDS